MTATAPARSRQLLATATAPDADQATQQWVDWRRAVPDLDLVTAAERALLPAAVAALGPAAGADRDAGRLRGLQRQAAVQCADMLARAAAVQQQLRRAGIHTALTAGAAAALAYPTAGRRPTTTADLVLAPRDVTTAVAPRPVRLRNRVARRLPSADPTVVLRWEKRPACAGPPAFGGHEAAAVRQWQGRPLAVAPPHVAAFSCLLHAAAHLPTSPRQGQVLLDVWFLAQAPDFDAAAFRAAVAAGWWRAAIGSTARVWRPALPAPLADLLHPAPRAGRSIDPALSVLFRTWTRGRHRLIG